jgi:hypothetical protein
MNEISKCVRKHEKHVRKGKGTENGALPRALRQSIDGQLDGAQVRRTGFHH